METRGHGDKARGEGKRGIERIDEIELTIRNRRIGNLK
jgi:hypothetical protein